MSKTATIANIRADGDAVEVTPVGSERPFPKTPLRPMTDEDVHPAAMADPDARPMTDEEWQAARKVPRTKTLRRALGLAQEEFSTRFHIPLCTLRDWEQEKSQPDHSARAYLRAIAGDAAAVQRATAATIAMSCTRIQTQDFRTLFRRQERSSGVEVFQNQISPAKDNTTPRSCAIAKL